MLRMPEGGKRQDSRTVFGKQAQNRQKLKNQGYTDYQYAMATANMQKSLFWIALQTKKDSG